MNDITYDVRIYKTETYKGKKVTTYTVRWNTGGRRWKEAFRMKAQADSFRSSLLAAARKGEAFDLDTGRPVSWGRRADDTTWYAFCLAYVDMKWSTVSATYRRDIARALVAATPAMLATERGKPANDRVRTVLTKWAFNTKNRADCPEVDEPTLTWLEHNTKPLAALTDPSTMREVLTAAATRHDGKNAAATTVRRNRAILHNACEHAVELGLLPKNPVTSIKWKAPAASHEVDRRLVVNPTQARRLLDAVRAQQPSGPRLVAFFGAMYYAALRPEEAVNLHSDDITLPPEDDWGELHLRIVASEAGSAWTDDGSRREQRRLKHRAEGDSRCVPTSPPLTALLRAHLDAFGPGPDGRVFSGVRGGELPMITYRRAWQKARTAVFTEAQRTSPLAKRVYDLRHACVSTWLNGGVPPTQVAEWAGHSVDVLLKVYAKCVEGQEAMAKRRITEALRDS